MAVLGLCFCARAFSSCGKWGPLFIAVRGPLIITACLVEGCFKWQYSEAETLGIHGAIEAYLVKEGNLLTEMTKYVRQVLP